MAEFPAFLDWSEDFTGVVCPSCESHPRHRLFCLFAEARGLLREERPSILHVAPEAMLKRLFPPECQIEYVTADLYRTGVDVRLDIAAAPFRDQSFDIILCSHVLEVVADDRDALGELYRMLKPGGWVWLQVSMDYSSPTTLEDSAVIDPEERLRLYGHETCARLYGRDFGDRVRAAGLSLTESAYARDSLSHEQVRRYGLDRSKLLFFGTRGQPGVALSEPG